MANFGVAQIAGAAVPGESELTVAVHPVGPDTAEKSRIESRAAR